MSMSLWYCILAVMEQGSSCLCAKDFHFGYKMWYLNYPSGYLLAFDVYQGSKRQNTDSKDMFGVVGQNVLFLIDYFPEHELLHLFLDFFASVLLLVELRERETFLEQAHLERIELETSLYQP